MSKFIYRLLVVLSMLTLLLSGVTAPAYAAPWQDKVDPWVLQTAAEGETEFLVFLTTQANLGPANALSTKLEKGTYVYQTLTSVAERTQRGLIAKLEELGVAYRPYWVANMIWVRGSLSTVQLLAGRSDVAHLYANPAVALDAPEVSSQPSAQPEAIEWNISKVNAPLVWDLGYTGQGVVIGGQDTGYDWDHPALINQYRGWNGSSADHDYNWHDAIHSGGGACGPNSPEPCDDYGHGTHTMGTMVGDDGGSNQIGMAPGARWVGCRNMNVGVGTPSTYAECYEWFIAPYPVGGTPDQGDPSKAPDVINNSWGCPPSEGCTNPNVLLTVVQNLVAAGIVTAHSAGNSGSSCSSIDEPSAIYDESFTVGATNSGDSIASFSSRGPVMVDGSGRMKPDISAPGVNIRSSVPGGGYQGGWSGTSMAGPHVAGEVALLISAYPALRGKVDQIEYVIEQTAVGLTTSQGCGGDLPNQVPNNVYGWGRINALAAVDYFYLGLGKTASAAEVAPGDNITYTLGIEKFQDVISDTNVVLTDTLPGGTEFVSATPPYSLDGDVVRWDLGDLEVSGTVEVELVVNVTVTEPTTIVNADYAVSSDLSPMITGDPVSVQVLMLNSLAVSKAASESMAFPGSLITYTLDVTNTHASVAATGVVLTDTIPAGTTFISASLPYTLTGETIRWDFANLEASSSLSVDLVVRVDSQATGTVTNDAYGARSDQMIAVHGEPVNTALGRVFFLPFVMRGP